MVSIQNEKNDKVNYIFIKITWISSCYTMLHILKYKADKKFGDNYTFVYEEQRHSCFFSLVCEKDYKKIPIRRIVYFALFIRLGLKGWHVYEYPMQPMHLAIKTADNEVYYWSFMEWDSKIIDYNSHSYMRVNRNIILRDIADDCK